MVKILLADERVNPSAEEVFAIKAAAGKGHVEVVKLLLTDERVNPSAEDDAAFKKACANGHVEVVQLLLADGRANLSAEDEYAIKTAAQNGHVEVVRVLLADARMNASLVVMQVALKVADKGKHESVVRLLVNSQPQLLAALYRGEMQYTADGPLRQQLNRHEARSTFFLLMCVKRSQSNRTAARVSDVMREVRDEFACFV